MSRIPPDVEAMLSNRTGVPWARPADGMKDRTLAAIKASDAAGHRLLLPRVRLAAAACIALGLGVVVASRVGGTAGHFKAPPPSVQLDPSDLIAPALLSFSASADESLESEARGLLADANQLTRRVVARLPFTGGGL